MVIPTRLLPHLPLLVGDYFYNYAKVKDFYSGDFRELASFERQAERVHSRHIPREELAAVLREQNTSYGCGPRTLGQIDRIVRDQACAVVTGQQVGLFSGPLYTIYKALTTIKLSDHLNRSGLGSFVPVFWLASDDHDLAEIDHIALLDQENRLKEVRCPMPSFEVKIPASNLILPPDVLDCIQQLDDLTMDSEFKEEMIGRLREAYKPGRSFAEAFARWMSRLFESYGLILIDPSHPRLKEMGRDVFYQEMAAESPSTQRAMATSQRLRQAGYGPQIPLHEGILNIFYLDRERRTIQCKDGTFNVKGRPPLTQTKELLTWAKEKPFLFSPNVLLRSIYQDALLPTVAYVGGHAEIAYFAQMKGVYEAFHLPMPVIYPRKSLTIVEKKVEHILKKYDLKIPDLWSHAAGTIAEITKKQIPDSLDRALRLVLDHLEQDFEGLKREIVAFEPTLKESINLAKGKMNQQLKFVEKKILQAAAKRNKTALQQLHKVIDNLFPEQKLQERVFNIVPFLIKYGYTFMDKLDQAIDIDEHNHRILLI
jgi:bacillithiol biosynthesis cysteine-adding enzyme BshC